MSRQPFQRISYFFAISTLAAMGLSGCGGGGSSSPGSSSNPQASTQSTQAPSVVTVAAYAAGRRTTTSTNPASSITTSVPASIADATRQLAVEDMQIQLGSDNVTVAPALTLAHVNLLTAAASGFTLSQLTTAFPADPGSAAWLNQSSAVSRQLWAQRGQQFLASFLSTTDIGSSTLGSSTWREGETGFADQSVMTDAAVIQALASASSELYSSMFDKATHLLVVDSIKPQVSWPLATAFTGRYLDDNGSNYTLPMVSISQGVVQYSETGFVANAITINGLTVIAITPTSDTLKSFVTGQHLDAAIKNSVSALLGTSANHLPAGTLVLPAVSLRIPFAVDRLPQERMVAMAYNEVNANLKGLDGMGGTYVKVTSPQSHLDITTDGLALDSAYAAEFIYSPKNVYGPVTGFNGGDAYGAIISWNAPPFAQACSPNPDLRSMFLAVVDSTQTLLSLTAILQPGGNYIICRR